MDLRKLRLFLAVVDRGGMTRAAEAEYVSQPSVSQAMRELEAELGTPLFHRVGRRVVLTAAGDALIGPARQTLRDVETGRAAVAAVAGLDAGRLDVGALPTLAIDPVTPMVGAFRHAHPGVTVALADPADADMLEDLVATGSCELGVTVRTEPSPQFVSRELGTQDLLAVLPPGTPSPRTFVVDRRAGAHPPRRGAGRHRDPQSARGGVRRGRDGPGDRGGGRATGGDPALGARRRRRHPLPADARGTGGGARAPPSPRCGRASPDRSSSSTEPARSRPPPTRSWRSRSPSPEPRAPEPRADGPGGRYRAAQPRTQGASHGAGRVRRAHRAVAPRVRTVVARAGPRAGGSAQRRRRAARRRRLRPDRPVRVRHRHPHVRPARRGRRHLHQLPHHGAVLTDTGVRAHRAQPPQRRDGPDHRPVAGIPRVRRHHLPPPRVPPRHAHAGRMGGVRGREVAPDPPRPAAPRRPAHELAPRPRVRALLRVLRRREPPVRSQPDPRQPPGPRAGRLRRRLSPDRGSRRPRDRVPHRSAQRRIPTSRSSST